MYAYQAVGEYSVAARWTSSTTKKWRPRDPAEEKLETANSMLPMYVEGSGSANTPSKKDSPTDPIKHKKELTAAMEEEERVEEMRRKEESRAQYLQMRNRPIARARAKSAGPPGWRPPAKEDIEVGCLGPLEPLPPPPPKGRTNHSPEPPPPPPKRRPPPGPPPLSDMPATLKEREGRS